MTKQQIKNREREIKTRIENSLYSEEVKIMGGDIVIISKHSGSIQHIIETSGMERDRVTILKVHDICGYMDSWKLGQVEQVIKEINRETNPTNY